MNDELESQARQWLTHIASGRQSALENFYRHYHAQVMQFALRLVGNAADAAEITNESMLEVWRSAAGFAGGSKVRTWLFGIVNHRAIDLMRRRRRLQSDDLDELVDDSPSCHIADVVGGAQDAGHVRECVKQLPDRQKAVVHLAFFEGLSYPEVAEALHVPVGTVKTRVMHAKLRLQQCLSERFGVGRTE